MPKNPARRLSCGVFFGLLFYLSRTLAVPDPFFTRDHNPLILVYGLPVPVNARLPEEGSRRWVMLYNLSNTLNVESANGLDLRVDAETTQVNVLYEHSLPRQWMLRMQFAGLHHGPGFLDDPIDRYHDLLGLKEGSRPYVASNQFQIEVLRNSSPLLDLRQSQTGPGDTQVQLGKQLYRDTDQAGSLWFSLKLPTGDSARLTGSGHADLALWLATQQHGKRFTVMQQLGGVYMSGSEILPELHRSTAWFGNAGATYAWNDWLQLTAQLDVHSAFYDTQLTFLGPALQLAFGGSVIFNEHHRLDIAVSEDIKTLASPDVTFTLGWILQF